MLLVKDVTFFSETDNAISHLLTVAEKLYQFAPYWGIWQYPFNLKISDLNIITAITSITTIADFRRAT